MNQRVIHKLFYRLSPLALAVIFCAWMIIYSLLQAERSNGWSLVAAALFAPLTLIIVGLYFLVRYLTKVIFYIWLAEVVLLTIIFLLVMAMTKNSI